MKQNVKCTIEDIINLLKEKYLKEGSHALCVDSNWHIYVSDDNELFLTTACCMIPPPDFIEETDEEIIPAFAIENGRMGLFYQKFFKI